MISNFENQVAVITGGASGIGFAMARCALDAGMKVAIADINEQALAEAAIRLDGGDRLAQFQCDVSSVTENAELAAAVENRFGGANLLCLNAGMGRLRLLQETSIEDWQLQVNVNLNGPFYGARAFLPLLEQQQQSHIVVTASVMSLFSAPVMGPYYATKAGVLSFAESLFFDLQAAGSSVGVSALMPGDTNTNVVENSITDDTDPEIVAAAAAELAGGTNPMIVAGAVFEAVAENRFYVLPNPGDYWSIIDARIDRIRRGENPAVDYDTV